MEKQVLISISREFGSGGLDIAKLLGTRLNLPVYDKKILVDIANEKGADPQMLKKYDEKPRNPLLSRTVRNYTNSMEDNLVQMQFDFIRKKAESGESFLIVGRCSETVLESYENLVSIFVTGDRAYRTKRIMEQFALDEAAAHSKIDRIDRERRQYHNRYSSHKWGDSRVYDMCINGSDLGVEGTADILEAYIRARIAHM